MSAIATFFQLHNKATEPATDDIPVFSCELVVPDTGATVEINLGHDFFTLMGHRFSVGCSYGLSSTADTFTASAIAVNLILNGEKNA